MMHAASFYNLLVMTLAAVFGAVGLVHIAGPRFLRDAYDRWDYSQRLRLMVGLWQVIAASWLAEPSLRGWGIAVAAAMILHPFSSSNDPLFQTVVPCWSHFGRYWYASWIRPRISRAVSPLLARIATSLLSLKITNQRRNAQTVMDLPLCRERLYAQFKMNESRSGSTFPIVFHSPGTLPMK